MELELPYIRLSAAPVLATRRLFRNMAFVCVLIRPYLIDRSIDRYLLTYFSMFYAILFHELKTRASNILGRGMHLIQLLHNELKIDTYSFNDSSDIYHVNFKFQL